MKPQLWLVGAGVVAAVLCVPMTASAQHRRVPHQGGAAVGGEVGVFLAQQDGVGSGADLAGFVEGYLTARDSIRAVVGWANPAIEGTSNQTTREIRVVGELIHNWEGGAVHPFIGAGLGAYFLQPRVDGQNSGVSATRPGGTILGGAEFFTTRTFAVKAEVRYNVVSKWNGYDPSGLALTVGVKSYF